MTRFAELKTAEPTDRIALRGVRVRSRLAGFAQKTTLEQTFVNLEERAIEAVYTFPLPESAAVCGFEIITGDRVLTGTIDEAERAIEKYEDAITEGNAAYLLEQDRADVFNLRVGNIKPGQAATIKISYVCPLEIVDRELRVTYPTTMAPRFATSAGMDPLDAAIDGDALNPPHVLSVPYGLTLEVDVAMDARRIRKITSPSHAIKTQEPLEGVSRITLRDGIAAMDREVVLSIELTREQEPRIEVASGKPGSNESFLAVTFVPEFDEAELAKGAPSPNETIFVLDCSGSMQGQSTEQAIAALSLCLRSLSVGDTFNICRFGSTFELMSSEPAAYSQQTMEQALAYVNRRADLGGTELLSPLETILRGKPASGSVRQIILLTDGQVSNEPGIIALARRHRAHNRIFTFGIGPSCSQFLVKGLARATGGAAEFIAYSERIEEKVLRTFARLNSPIVADVQIDWQGSEVQTLAEIPPVFDGDALTVYARALGTLPKQIALRCNAGGRKCDWTVPVSYSIADPDRVIATMWARRTIQSLEEVNDVRRSRLLAAGPSNSRERELLLQLSKDFNLLCALTSFVAIEHRNLEERNDGQPELRRVPVALAQGWGGVRRADPGIRYALRRPSTARCAIPTGIEALLEKSCTPKSPGIAVGSTVGLVAKFLARVVGDNEDSAKALRVPAAQPTPLQQLLSSQTAAGTFAFDALTWPQLAQSLPHVQKWRASVERAVAEELGTNSPERAALEQTVLVILILRSALGSERTLWRRAEAKATRWIESVTGKSHQEIESWLTALEVKLPVPT